MDSHVWMHTYLLSAILIAIAGMSLVSARNRRDRLLAAGILTQGILMGAISANLLHHRTELQALAATLLMLFLLWCLWGTEIPADPHTERSVAMLNTESQQLSEGSFNLEIPPITDRTDTTRDMQ